MPIVLPYSVVSGVGVLNCSCLSTMSKISYALSHFCLE